MAKKARTPQARRAAQRRAASKADAAPPAGAAGSKAAPRRRVPRLFPIVPYGAGGPNGSWWPAVLWLVLFASAYPPFDGGDFWGGLLVLAFIGLMTGQRYASGKGAWQFWVFWLLWFVGVVFGMVDQAAPLWAGLACGLLALYWNLRRRGGRLGGLTTDAFTLQAAVAALALTVGIGTHALRKDDLAPLQRSLSASFAAAARGEAEPPRATVRSARELTATQLHRGDPIAVQGEGHCKTRQLETQRVHFDCNELGWRPDHLPPFLFDRPEDAQPAGETATPDGAAREAYRLARLLQQQRPQTHVAVQIPAGGDESRRPHWFDVADPTVRPQAGDVAGADALRRVREQLADGARFEIRGRLVDRWTVASGGGEVFVIDARPTVRHVNPLAWTAFVLGVAFLVLAVCGGELAARGYFARRQRVLDRMRRARERRS